MSEPFLAEITIVSFNFAPRGWAHCDGQLLPINQNQALFSLLGTTYGGDGRTTFALPDLRGRTPIHKDVGGVHPLSQKAGEQAHTLTVSEIPNHDHRLSATSDQGSETDPSGNVLASKARRGRNIYAAAANLTPLSSASITTVGARQSHENMQPFLTLGFVIALQGVFPSRS